MVSLPVGIVYANKTRVSQNNGHAPIRFLLLDVVEGMPIVSLRCSTCTSTAFNSLEHTEGWLLRDRRWKHRREDVSVLRRFLIYHNGGWQTLHRALEVDGLTLQRSEIGTRLASQARAPQMVSTFALASIPPALVHHHQDDDMELDDDTASFATAVGEEDDIVAKAARCAMRHLSAYHIDRHQLPLASAIHSPVKPQDLFLRENLWHRGFYHVGGNEIELVSETEQRWKSITPSERHRWRARYWGARVREATDVPRLFRALERWHDEVLALGAEAEAEGDYPPPTVPPVSALSPLAPWWKKQAFREMTAAWLAKEPWEEGVAEGSEFDDALAAFSKGWTKASLTRQWEPLATRKRKKAAVRV